VHTASVTPLTQYTFISRRRKRKKKEIGRRKATNSTNLKVQIDIVLSFASLSWF
jgi:hypothetical protein